MKKLKQLKWAYYSLMISIIISSCSNSQGIDDLYDVSANQRIENNKSELKNLLTSSEFGWKMVYFTDSQRFGGFTFLMRFSENNVVQMFSDIDGDTNAITNDYTIQLGATTKLNFNGNNHIHKLLDTHNPQTLRGFGYRGSSEFLFYGTEGDNIIFRSVKAVQNEVIIFKRATQNDWDNLITQNVQNIERLTGTSNDPVFRGLRVTVDGVEETFPFSYNSILRKINVFGTSSLGNSLNLTASIAFDNNGFISSSDVVANNQTFNNFQWDDQLQRFISQNDNGATAELLFFNEPINRTDDYLLINNPDEGGHRIFTFSSWTNALINAPYSSPRFLEIYFLIRQTFEETEDGRRPYRFRLLFYEGTDRGRIEYTYVTTGGAAGTLYHYFTYIIDDDRVVLRHNYWSATNRTASREAALAPLDEMLLNPQGFYIELVPETYTTNEPVYTFTSASETSVRFPTRATN